MTGAPIFIGEIHDLADFLGIRFAEGSAENGEILSKYVNEAAINAAIPGNDAIAGILLVLHPEIDAAMGDEFVDFFKRIAIQQKRDALTGGHFAFRPLLVEPLLSAAEFGGPVHLEELFDACRCGDLGHWTTLLQVPSPSLSGTAPRLYPLVDVSSIDRKPWRAWCRYPRLPNRLR